MQEQEKARKAHKPYEKPTATKLTTEEAKIKLLGHAMMGDEKAKELLNRFFDTRQENSESEDPNLKRKSA